MVFTPSYKIFIEDVNKGNILDPDCWKYPEIDFWCVPFMSCYILLTRYIGIALVGVTATVILLLTSSLNKNKVYYGHSEVVENRK